MDAYLSELVGRVFNDNFELDESALINNAKPVASITNPIKPVQANHLSINVLDRFIKDQDDHFYAVIDQSYKPVGIIDRILISEIFIKPFSRDLYHKQKISEVMFENPVIVDINTSIDDLANIIIDAGMEHMRYGIIIVQDGVYAGMATGHALLEELTKRKQRDLYYLAHYDQLTGIPNRLLFNDRLNTAIETAKRTDKRVVLMFIDLDKFKHYNDTHGHQYGDLILKQAAKRIKGLIRKSDTVARIGGDEFVCLFQNIELNAVEKVAEKMLSRIIQPMEILEVELYLTASIGIATYPDQALSVDELISKADAAMYEIKQHGRNGYLVYENTLSVKNNEKNHLINHLKTAIANNELSLVYQPQIDIGAGRINGVEVLLRWNSPVLGFVSPDKFIPLAEESGLIHKIGIWVLRTACEQFSQWPLNGSNFTLAVNVSGYQIFQDNFAMELEKIMNEFQMNAELLELELTESIMMNEISQIKTIFNKIKEMGVKLALDDFGTGYSSLNYLRHLPFDKIKIDRAFVTNISSISANEAIFQSVINLCQNLGLQVLAEGVEDYDDLSCVEKNQCHLAQGYYFSKPLPNEQFIQWVKDFDISHYH